MGFKIVLFLCAGVLGVTMADDVMCKPPSINVFTPMPTDPTKNVVFCAEIDVTIDYKTKNGTVEHFTRNSSDMWHAVGNATFTGNNLAIPFFNGGLVFTFVVSQNETMNRLSEATLQYNGKALHFIDPAVNGTSVLTFAVPPVQWKDPSYYACNAEFSLTPKNGTDGEVTLKDFKIQLNAAGRQPSGTAEHCAADGTTTVAPATTTMAPVDEVFVVTDPNTKEVCIALKSEITLKITDGDNSTSLVVTNKTNTNFGVKVDPAKSFCVDGAGDEQMTLEITVTKGMTTPPWILMLKFSDLHKYTKADNKSAYQLIDTVLTYNPHDLWTNAKDKAITVESNLTSGVQADVGKSWQCNHGIHIDLGKDVTVQMDDLHLQAFMNNETLTDATGPYFSSAQHCAADDSTNDLVPIIVGACLAGLVIVVLIAYLVGRAKAKEASAYESV